MKLERLSAWMGRRRAPDVPTGDTPDFDHLARRVVLVDAGTWTPRELSLVPHIAAALRQVWDMRRAVDQSTIAMLEARIANLETLLDAVPPPVVHTHD